MPSTLTPTSATCARCGAIVCLDSSACTPVAADDGPICAACDERELADLSTATVRDALTAVALGLALAFTFAYGPGGALAP